MLSGFGGWGSIPAGSRGRAPASFITETNGGGTRTAWWWLRVQPSGKAALFRSQPSCPSSPLWPRSQDAGCQAVPALLTKAGLSGAEQGRPTGRTGAPHHALSLRKWTDLVQCRGEGIPLMKYLLSDSVERPRIRERKVLWMPGPTRAVNAACRHPNPIRLNPPGFSKPPSNPLPLSQSKTFSFALKTGSIS